MYAIIDMIASTVDIVALSILVMFVPSFVFFTLRARRGIGSLCARSACTAA